MKKAKLIFFALAALSMLFAVSCSKKAETGGEAAASADTAQAKSGTPREIVFWDMMWGPAATYPGAISAIVEKFNTTNTDNIHVTTQVVPWDNFYQVFLTAVTSKAAPDVSTGAFMQSIQYAEMGEGLNLDPIVEQWKAENNPILKDYSEAMFNLHMYEGSHYGIPWNLDTRQILYRKDYMEKAGVTKLPTNWNEFLDMCAKLKKALPADVYPLSIPGGGDYNGLQALMNFMFMNGVGPTDAKGMPDYLNPKTTEVLKFIHELYVKGYVAEGLPAYKGTDAEKLFQAGKAVMYMHTTMDLTDFPEIDKVAAIMPPFAGPSGKAQNYTWVNAIEGYKQTKDPEAALAFIKWLAENEGPLWETGKLTALPARASFRQQPYFQTKTQLREVNEYVLPTAVTPCYPCPYIYLPFSVIEGEAIPMEGMVAVLIKGEPDYAQIQQAVQKKMQDAWAEFDM